MSVNANRNEFIDLLKGIGMVMVILVHSRQAIPNISSLFDIFKFGQMGCQIFLFCTGFLAMKAKINGKKEFGNFLLRKYSALIPGWYLIIFITYFLNLYSMVTWGMDIGFAQNRDAISIICNLLFLHGLMPFCNNDVVAGGVVHRDDGFVILAISDNLLDT